MICNFRNFEGINAAQPSVPKSSTHSATIYVLRKPVVSSRLQVAKNPGKLGVNSHYRLG